MKVLFIVRSTLFTARGGDTVQVVETAAHLRILGVEVDIRRTDEPMHYAEYDLLHFFNIIRPADILVHISRSGKPFVISPILVDYSYYEKQVRTGFAGKIFRKMPASRIEYAKTIYRALRRRDRLMSYSYILKGQDRSIREILGKAGSVLVNAEEEYRELVDCFDTRPPYSIVPNGINSNLFIPRSDIQKEDNLVLCVARIEGIKNQLNLVKAMNNSTYQLILIGKAAPSHKSYYKACREAAGSNIRFIDHLPQEELVIYYARAKVHVLPSWFELCGLASLEAAAMGCNAVITDHGYARSYFGENAFYADPSMPSSIFKAVAEAAQSPVNEAQQKIISTKYTWQLAAEKIYSVYKQFAA